MALTTCRECGSQMSTSADACPKCGAKPKRRSFGFTFLLAAIGFIVLVNVIAGLSSIKSTPTDRGAKQDSAKLVAAQEATFSKHRDAILKMAGDALNRGDLKAAGDTLDPLSKVADPNLQKLRGVLRSKRNAAAVMAEIEKLEKEIETLEPDDAITGFRVYARLVELVPENKTYAARRDAIEKQLEEQAAISLAKAQLDKRRRIATDAEENFLKRGFSVTIKPVGKDETVLQIEFVLVSKAFAYQISHQDDFIDACRKAGFKRIVMKDGYSETWTIDL